MGSEMCIRDSFSTESNGVNCATIMPNRADIIFNHVGSHLETRRKYFGGSLLIPNNGVKMVLMNWVSIMFNREAKLLLAILFNFMFILSIAKIGMVTLVLNSVY